jgi:hypothetical protein
MLANSQNFICQKQNGFYPSQDEGLALTHHHKALRQASDLMKTPGMHNSDEVIGAISSLICHQVSFSCAPNESILTHLRHSLEVSGEASGPSTEMLSGKSSPFVVALMQSSQSPSA